MADNSSAPRYAPDRGGQFASDAHRRVLGHLSTHRDSHAWTPMALFVRMAPDVGSQLSQEQVAEILGELGADGLARQVAITVGDQEVTVWQMTEEGFNLLTGPIADEPPPGAVPQGPAQIGVAISLDQGPTQIPQEQNDAANQAS